MSESTFDSITELTSNGLAKMHLNIQSIRPKLDILELEAQPYDILVFAETWLNSTVSNDDLVIANFNLPFRCDRRDRAGGGVAVYVRNTIRRLKDRIS